MPATLSILLVSCATVGPKPEPYASYQAGRWDTRVKVIDTKKGRSVILDGIIAAQRPDQIRLDLLTTMGTSVLTMVVAKGEVRYALPREKKFVITAANDRAFLPALGLRLDPTILLPLVFDQALPEKVWTCVRDQEGYLIHCKNLRTRVDIHWLKREGQSRTIEIASRTGHLQITLNEFQPKVENAEKLFNLLPPKNYKVE